MKDLDVIGEHNKIVLIEENIEKEKKNDENFGCFDENNNNIVKEINDVATVERLETDND